jgi:hypothetical protein
LKVFRAIACAGLVAVTGLPLAAAVSPAAAMEISGAGATAAELNFASMSALAVVMRGKAEILCSL